MTTFKTPLPKKYRYPQTMKERETNQLIDCIAELREVVEGKQVTADGWENGQWVGGPEEPTLKETLLEALFDLPFCQTSEDERSFVARIDVEAIINKLIP